MKAGDTIYITWSGGNGPHRYRIGEDRFGNLFVMDSYGCHMAYVDSTEFRCAKVELVIGEVSEVAEWPKEWEGSGPVPLEETTWPTYGGIQRGDALRIPLDITPATEEQVRGLWRKILDRLLGRS